MQAGGIVVVDKPAGLTSHDVVARVRRLAGTRRVGHAGTLDPMATGVLVLGVDRGTRLLGQLAPTSKTYSATMRLGAATTTADAEGEVTASRRTTGIGDRQVRDALSGFVGVLDQVPSSVSAIKVGGQCAYARARRGESVRLEPRSVVVHRLDVTAVRPGTEHVDVDVTLRCSSGTYVRALARDLGVHLGVGGHLTALRRTAVGPFGLDTSHTLADLEQNGVRLVSLADAAGAVFPTVVCDDTQARAVSHGQTLDLPLGGPGPSSPGSQGEQAGTVALVDGAGALLGLYERSDGTARAIAVFAPA